MYPKVSYTKNGSPEPIVVDCLAADMMLANKLCAGAPKLVDLCTLVAYMAEHENEPAKMDQVQKCEEHFQLAQSKILKLNAIKNC